MALTAPVPTINGSQTEFSKVWIRGSTATATLPNIKLYSADGRAHHPYTGVLNVTIAHTAADTLYNRIQAAATAADATLTAARFDRWFKKAKITGFSCDAITGDTLLVNRSETTGLTDTAVGDDGLLPAKAAATFYAQETYAVGRPFMHGNIPAELVGLTGATVNVSGEVETSQAWKTGAPTTGNLAAIGDYIQGDCAGMASLSIDCTVVGTFTTSSFSVYCYVNGVWTRALLAIRNETGAAWTTTISSGTVTTALKLWAHIIPGATAYRFQMIAGTTSTPTPYTFKVTPSAQPFAPYGSYTSGFTSILGLQAHDSAANGNILAMGAEGRSTDGTAVANGDATRLLATLLGKLVALPYALPDKTWQYAKQDAGGTTDTSDVTLAAAGAAGVRNFVTAVQIVNMSTTATEVVIKDGSTILWRCELDADGGASGISVIFPTPLKGTAATAVTAACVTTGAKVYINAQGYSGAE